MRLSVIIVQYRTPDLVEACLRALGPVLSRPDAECLVIDNDEQGSRPSGDASPLAAARWLTSGTNLGYAGGINLGVEETCGDLLVVMNPDVLVVDGCVERLCSVLESGVEIAGPRFYWDQELRLLIPPAEERSRRAELLTAAASRSPGLAERARRRWRRNARRHWRSRDPLDSWDLPGALLAFQRSAFERIGPFDSGYQLYFEETDWLTRARQFGAKASHVPDAVAVHLYDQSARVEPSSPQWFAESASRYRRRHYGSGFERLLATVERPLPAVPADAALASSDPVRAPPHSDESVWLELSPRRLGFPAVGEEVAPGSVWAPPRSLERWHAGVHLWGRWVSSGGCEIGQPFVLEVAR